MARRRQVICYTTEQIHRLAGAVAKRHRRTVSSTVEILILAEAERLFGKAGPPEETREAVDDRAAQLLGD